tara:strand:- start:102 stop:575 length:474 start_codon:yes stop_codon:yes gene_type:complete
MIIQCINCNKKFEVNSDLIPSEGRNIQCGSCNHLWFFKKEDQYIENFENEKQDNMLQIDQKKGSDQFENDEQISNKPIKKIKKEKRDFEIVKYKQKSFSFGKLLSYLVVLIITFIAFLIVIDTFKIVLFDIFPNLELMIINLYEVFKDIELFIKDLL